MSSARSWPRVILSNDRYIGQVLLRVACWAAALGVAWAVLPGTPAAGQTANMGVNFAGGDINGSGSVIPPDTMGAVGRDQFVEFINGAFLVYRKSGGAAVTSTTDAQFWANAGLTLSSDISDPRVIFDHASGRWFASQVDGLVNTHLGVTANNFLLAVSATSDPTGPWTGFKISANSGTSNIFADFPTLGLDANAVYLGSNNFKASGNGSFANSVDIVAVPKAALLQAVPSTAGATVFQGQSASTFGWAPQGVLDFGATTGPGVMLAAGLNNQAFDTTHVSLININNPAGPSAAVSATDITVPTLAPPSRARQPDGTSSLDTGDLRFSSRPMRVGDNLWAVQNLSQTTGGVTHDVIRWYKINLNNNSVQSGTLGDGDTAHDYFYPSIAVNTLGDVVIGFNRSGPAENVSAYAIVGADGATPTFGAPILLKTGSVNNYFRTNGGSSNRWGDYSATSLDPADPSIFWTVQEWPSASNQWATQITELIVPKAGEFRWQTAANGTFGVGANWISGVMPSTGDLAIFSRATAPGPGYTVTFASSAANDRASVRQGTLTWDLAGNTYSLTDTSSTSPALALSEFQGTSNLTVSGNGTLSTVHTTLASGAGSTAVLTLGGNGATQWDNSGSVYVGGSSTAPGGLGTLTINSGGSAAISQSVTLWPTGSLNVNAGGQWTSGAVINNGTFTVTGGSAATAAINGSGAVSVLSNGSLTADSIQQTSLHLDSGGTATIRPSGSNANTSRVSALILGGTPGSWSGKLDVNDNKLIIDNANSAAAATTYTTVNNQLKQGFDNGAWDGQGIISTKAQTDVNNGVPVTIGVINNDDGTGNPAFFHDGSDLPQFGGQTVNGTAVLAKYTYFGDADLSGTVDAVDYTFFVAGVQSGGTLTGWQWGDFDYSGTIDAVDYSFFVFGVQGQGAPLASAPAPAPGGSGPTTPGATPAAIPEPGSFSLLGLAGISLLRLRKRKPG